MTGKFPVDVPIEHVIDISAFAGGRKLQIYQDAQAQQGIGFFGFVSDESGR